MEEEFAFDGMESFIIDDILGVGDEFETDRLPDPGSKRVSPKLRLARIVRAEAVKEVVMDPPKPGESIHVVSGAKFDFWNWVPRLLEWIDGPSEMFYCSTWTLSRPNAVDMFNLWDAGRFGGVAFLTGLYFKRRESAVYTYLLEGIQKRGGRYKAFPNHAKVMLLNHPERNYWLSVEGSANLTANPRLEQFVISNNRELWSFHRQWMEEMLAK